MHGPLPRASSTFEKEMWSHRTALSNFALQLTNFNHARAEDLVQETFAKAWAARASYEPGSNMKGWLSIILRNTHYTQHRKRRHEQEDPDEVMSLNLTELPRQLDDLDLGDLGTMMDRLPLNHREALMFVIVYGHTYEEAAVHFGCAVGTVKSRVFRARNTLAAMMMHSEQNESNTLDYDPDGWKAIAKALGDREYLDFDPFQK
jgi:RNA polymerase sigma-70 factor (ECF subfamily)